MANGRNDFVRWMGPLLDTLRELGGSGKPREVVDRIAEKSNLSDETLEVTLKSGQTKFYNQVHWARQYLVWEELLDSSARGVWTLTPRGSKTVLNEGESRKIVAKWVKFHSEERRKNAQAETPVVAEIEAELNESDDVFERFLDRLKNVSPEGFEQICGLLLRESGFEQVTITGRPKDGGIDGNGVLQINAFVSMKVLFQCKRYRGTVSRSDVGDFRNAMIGRAEKGIMITTGSFSMDARREAVREGAPPIELVDGERLVELFKRAELGLKPKLVTVYELDESFFAPYLSK